MATTWRDIDGNAVAFDDDGRVRLVVSDGVAGAFDKLAGVGVDADAVLNRLIDQAQHADPPMYRREAPQASAHVVPAATVRPRACHRQRWSDARASRVSGRPRQHRKVFA